MTTTMTIPVAHPVSLVHPDEITRKVVSVLLYPPFDVSQNSTAKQSNFATMTFEHAQKLIPEQIHFVLVQPSFYMSLRERSWMLQVSMIHSTLSKTYQLARVLQQLI